MGGHGALMVGLRNPDRFISVSAFSAMVNPSVVPWGIKAFTGMSFNRLLLQFSRYFVEN